MLVASPDYLARRGVPKVPADLVHHDCIGIRLASGRIAWELIRGPASRRKSTADGDSRFTHHPKGTLTVAGQLDASLMACLYGAGIAPTSELTVAAYVQANRLVRVLPDYRIEVSDADRIGIFVQHPHRKHMPAKVRVLLDFLFEHFGGQTLSNPTGLEAQSKDGR